MSCTHTAVDDVGTDRFFVRVIHVRLSQCDVLKQHGLMTYYLLSKFSSNQRLKQIRWRTYLSSSMEWMAMVSHLSLQCV